jgi:hypothetical protein
MLALFATLKPNSDKMAQKTKNVFYKFDIFFRSERLHFKKIVKIAVL